MPLTRTFFTIYLDQPDDPEGYIEHRVEVRGADQLRAETEGKGMGVTIKDSMHQTYLWAWAAACREGKVDMSFRTFRTNVISVEQDDDDAEGVPVDPTQPAASAG
jgi:hypothetical protein